MSVQFTMVEKRGRFFFLFLNSIVQFLSVNSVDDNVKLQCQKVGHPCCLLEAGQSNNDHLYIGEPDNLVASVSEKLETSE